MFLLLPAIVVAAPKIEGVGPGVNALEGAFADAADEFDVPASLLMAISWEATRWNPDAVSKWGGYGMFDLREGDQDPSLEHAAALLSVDPNLVATDWRLNLRGAAAILADQGRATGASEAELMSWWNAVRAFSGREEPLLQDRYAEEIFRAAGEGLLGETEWGTTLLLPSEVDTDGLCAYPPPAATDSALASQFYAACSSNYSDYSRGAGDIDVIVIHTVQGSYSGCYAWFANCSASVSAHYVVRSSDGQITQSVYEEDVAWHAGNWDYNLRSIGIEHEGYVDNCDWYTDAMYAGSAALTVDISNRQGVPLDRSHIIGHVEVPSATHTDPGDCWDWDYYMALVNGETSTASGEIIGVVADSDIFNGARLVGATVRIDETGQTTTVESDGYYRFDDMPFGTYTMRASYPGYAEGTCGPKATSTSQDWCSIALFPDAGGDDDDDDDTDTDAEDTDTDAEDTDTFHPPDTDSLGPPDAPGDRVRLDEVSAASCGCNGGVGGVALWLGVAVLPLVTRRRRLPMRR